MNIASLLRSGMWRTLLRVSAIAAAPATIGAAIPPDEVREEAELVEIVSSTPEDLGDVPHFAEVTREVVLRNITNGPVAIEVTGANCGCLTATLSSNRLEPGETATFTLRTFTRMERAIQPYAASLEAFDPRDPTISQTIVVNMWFRAGFEYDVQPRRLVVHQELGTRGEASFLVRPYFMDNISILSAETGHPEAVSVEPRGITIGGSGGALVRITTNFDREGLYLAHIRVTTDCEKYPEFILPLNVRVGPPAGSSRTLVLDGAAGQPAADAIIPIAKFAAEAGVEPADFIFDPRVPGLVASLKEGEDIIVSCRFADIAEPAGTSELVLLGPEGHELSRHKVVWIGALERLQEKARGAEEPPALPAPPR